MGVGSPAHQVSLHPLQDTVAQKMQGRADRLETHEGRNKLVFVRRWPGLRALVRTGAAGGRRGPDLVATGSAAAVCPQSQRAHVLDVEDYWPAFVWQV